ncbi:MAG TPA: helix-turn-helix transcriptional regulator [Candidatus Dormibacteraeota bacterium]|jgi:transcriptional regulator with XRE-family HTH domain|nr:helix-turn-helix transcriptional regulator [Candidatus Dormibacteraeota bacterium]
MVSDTGTEPTRLRELGAFLRSRRARLRPEEVGLPNGLRRRTPGLRREEVAQLAGVGLTWYTWLEQGRDIQPSLDVLCRVARALQLEPVERLHLFRLAGHEPPAGFSDEAVRPAHRRVIERWDPLPALITGWRRDLLAWNRAAGVVLGIDGLPAGRRNLLWAMFMVPGWRRLFLNWEDEAARTVARFRTEVAPHLDEPACKLLIAELSAESPEFVAFWERRDVHGRTDGLKRLRHPELGDLELEYTTYRIDDQPGLRLCFYTPEPGSPTERALQRLGERLALSPAPAPCLPVTHGAGGR